MVLKLYGFPSLTCTKTVRCVLEELNVPYEVIVVDIFKGEHKTRAFKTRQPFGLVPYIDDDGFILYESRAICRYIALKYGGVGKLMPDPADVRKTALFEQAASVEEHNFDRAAYGLVHEEHGTAHALACGEMRERLAWRSSSTTAPHWNPSSKGTNRSCAGHLQEFSLVDIFHLFYGSLLTDAGLDWTP